MQSAFTRLVLEVSTETASFTQKIVSICIMYKKISVSCVLYIELSLFFDWGCETKFEFKKYSN